MSSRYSTSTAGGEPESWHPWNLPLTAMTMSAQDQVDGMLVVHHVEDVGGVCEEERVAAVGRWGNASQIRSMKRGVVDSNDRQFSGPARDERTLIDQ